MGLSARRTEFSVKIRDINRSNTQAHTTNEKKFRRELRMVKTEKLGVCWASREEMNFASETVFCGEIHVKCSLGQVSFEKKTLYYDARPMEMF